MSSFESKRLVSVIRRWPFRAVLTVCCDMIDQDRHYDAYVYTIAKADNLITKIFFRNRIKRFIQITEPKQFRNVEVDFNCFSKVPKEVLVEMDLRKIKGECNIHKFLMLYWIANLSFYFKIRIMRFIKKRRAKNF